MLQLLTDPETLTLREAATALEAIEAEVSRRELVDDETVPPVYQPLTKPARNKGAFGGRGSGKSHIFGKLLLSQCVKFPGTRAVCLREHQVSLEQSVKRLLEDKITKHHYNDKFRVLDTHIETPGDGIIIFQGMKNHTAESIKSLEGYRIAWFEEAQTASERSLTLLRPTIRTEGSELWFSWNPRHDTDPVDVYLRQENLGADAVVVRSTYRDNPYFPEVLRKEMEWDRARDPEKYAHVWLGEYERHSTSRVFKNWRVEAFETPDDATLYFGGDWGYSVDPTVLARCWVRGKQLFIDYEAYKIGCEIDHIPALFDTVPGSRVWPVIADSARPETIAYLQRNGFPKLEAATKGANSVKEGVIFLQGYDIVIHPRCVHTIDEFTMYSFKTDPLTDIVTPILEDKKNHVIDSVRYAVEKLRQPKLELVKSTW